MKREKETFIVDRDQSDALWQLKRTVIGFVVALLIFLVNVPINILVLVNNADGDLSFLESIPLATNMVLWWFGKEVFSSFTNEMEDRVTLRSQQRALYTIGIGCVAWIAFLISLIF